MESSILDGDLLIGDYVVRPLLKVIRPISGRDREDEQRLPDKAMAVLVYLAQRSRQVCERDEILDAVWGSEREAYDRVLDNAIREIRRALGDDARNPAYIQTISKRGYRLLVNVESRLLQRQQDSSGEFVPLAGASAPQVYRRVRRKLGDSRLDEDQSRSAGEPAASEATDETPAPEADRVSDPRHARTTSATSRGSARPIKPNAVAVVVVSAVLGSLAWWRLAIADPGQSVEVVAHAGSQEVPSSLLRAVRDGLLAGHPCGDDSLLEPARFGAADLQVALSLRTSEDQTVLDATSALDGVDRHLASVGTLATEDLAAVDLTGFRQSLVASLDHAVCLNEALPPTARACHCLAATRTLNVITSPTRHIEDLRLAVELDPDLGPAYEALSTAYGMAGDGGEQKAVLEAGLARIDDPTSVNALRLRRALARAHQDFPTELDLLELLIQREPERPDWRAAKASFEVLHDRHCGSVGRELVPYLEGGNGLQSPLFDGIAELWICRLQDTALGILETGSRRTPRDLEVRHRHATALMLAGHYAEAYQTANELLALSPALPGTYWLLGTISLHRGELAAAEQWFLQAEPYLRWPIERGRNRRGLARVALQREQGESCAELFDDITSEGLDTDGHASEQLSHWAQGLCLVEAGELERARRVLEHMQTVQRARSTRWQDSHVLHLESRIATTAGDDQEGRRLAAQLMLRALANKPLEFPYFATEAAVAQEAAGDPVRARQLYEEALGANPNFPWANCRLGLLLQRQGQEELAVDHLRRSMEVFGKPPETPIGRLCAGTLQALEAASGSVAGRT